MAEARELLRRLNDDTAKIQPREISAPTEMTVDEISARPVESDLDLYRRRVAQRVSRWAEQRAEREECEMSEALASLEARIDARLASLGIEQCEASLEMIEDVLAIFAEEVTIPLERQLAAMREQVATLEVQLKKLELGGGAPINLPNVLDARRVQ